MGSKYHLAGQPIPSGFRLYEDRLDVMGVLHSTASLLAFCRGKSRSVELDPEPGNAHDPNAIKVMGVWTGWFLRHRTKIGYVPREVAARLAETDLLKFVAGRLLKTYIGTGDFVEVQFQIIGRSDAYTRYAAAKKASGV